MRAHLLDLGEVVRAHHDGPVARHLADGLPDRRRRRGVEPGGRFVEEHDFRIAEEGLRERDALRHAVRQSARGARHHVAEPDHLERPRGGFVRRVRSLALQARERHELLDDGDGALERRVLWKHRDAAAERAHAARVRPEDLDRAAARPQEVRCDAEQRGLSRAVRTEEPEQRIPSGPRTRRGRARAPGARTTS